MAPRIPCQQSIYKRARPPRCLSARHTRLLSTTPSSLAAIPPESPKFINVPLSLQPDAIVPPQIKGILPVPRKVFPYIPSPNDKDKTSPAYLLQVTLEPKPKGTPPPFTDPTTAAFVAWKERQAAARRRNLREGLIELKHRKEVTDAKRNRRAQYMSQERERLVATPMREDERLTGPTILQSQLPTRLRRGGKPQPLPDPDRERRVERARRHTAEHEMKRRGERRDDLHTLYMNSRTFITKEEELDKEVERVFHDIEQFKNSDNYGENVWNLGQQTTVAEMLNHTNEGGKAIDAGRGGQMVKERYERMAEILTGGKM